MQSYSIPYCLQAVDVQHCQCIRLNLHSEWGGDWVSCAHAGALGDIGYKVVIVSFAYNREQGCIVRNFFTFAALVLLSARLVACGLDARNGQIFRSSMTNFPALDWAHGSLDLLKSAWADSGHSTYLCPLLPKLLQTKSVWRFFSCICARCAITTALDPTFPSTSCGFFRCAGCRFLC